MGFWGPVGLTGRLSAVASRLPEFQAHSRVGTHLVGPFAYNMQHISLLLDSYENVLGRVRVHMLSASDKRMTRPQVL